MKKSILTILLYGAIILIITGCNNKLESTNKDIDNNSNIINKEENKVTQNEKLKDYNGPFELVFNPKPGNVIKQIINKNTNKQYSYNVYVLNGDASIIIDNIAYSLEEALNDNIITMEKIIEKADKDFPNNPSYDDGGSTEYHYDNYTIIKFWKIDGNRDVYIGDEKLTIYDVD